MKTEAPGREVVWAPARRPWGWPDALALAAWAGAILVIFRDAVLLREALFYFDITEINYAYRDFLARELRAGRFSRWFPGLYCGMPLYSESQAGYLHPLKGLLYPWLPTWQALNLDTVLSVGLTGVATYGWLRRHVGPAGALAGAAVFGLGGFVWAHLIHTSMVNALISVPLAVWALECAWEGGRLRGVALGALALACQVFAGHLQDTLLTGLLIGVYGLYRAAIERGRGPRMWAGGMAAGLVALGIVLAAVQWVPSKELLDRSPRAGGLSWDDLTYGSWHPELLPSLVVREAYGTRARDTDWMDGFYPYHEMNAYLGVVGLALAVVGAAAYRDRWVAFWVLLAGIGGVLMLGRFTLLFDAMPRVPILGSSRIPVRYHLWVSLAVAALAAVGVDRLARPGRVSLRGAVALVAVLVVVSVPILAYVYRPAWTQADRWRAPYHLFRFHWLGRELAGAGLRTAVIALAAWAVASLAARTARLRRRSVLAALLPVLLMADLLGAHWDDVPTVAPAYWTEPPASARLIRVDPAHRRVFGVARYSAGEPGYASRRVDFSAARDPLAWSLPPIWGLDSASGASPLLPRRMLRYTDHAAIGGGRFVVEGVTHFLTGFPEPVPGWPPPEKVGAAYLHRNPEAAPRARLMGRPLYAGDERAAARALQELGAGVRGRVIVEDANRPLAADAAVSGTAAITAEAPERVEVATESAGDAYLVLADSFDPGWSASLDGRLVPIRPAFVAFRAVFVPKGNHRIVFTYRPAGFDVGLAITAAGLVVGMGLLFWPRRVARLGPEHGDSGWPGRWPAWGLAAIVALIAVSAVQVTPAGPRLHRRWTGSVHRFTWGAGIEAIRPRPPISD